MGDRQGFPGGAHKQGDKPMTNVKPTILVIAACGASLLAVAAPATASIVLLPDATYTATITHGNGRDALPTIVTRSTPGKLDFRGTHIVLSTKPTPSITTTSDSAASFGTDAVNAEVVYHFRLNGPGTDPVPLSAHVIAHAFQTSSSFEQSIATVIVNIATTSLYYGGYSARIGDAQGFTAKHSLDQIASFYALPGGINSVDLLMGTTGTSDTYVDPFIFIDPAFAKTHPGYSLSFSAGAGNSPSAVPEPAALALLGLGGLGLAALRRRRSI